MFSEKAKKKSAVLMYRVGVALLVILFVVVLGPGLLNLESSQARAHDDRDDHDRGDYRWHDRAGACTQTAEAAYKACLNEKADDYNIAVGNCINVSDYHDRKDCFNDALNGEDGYEAAKEECKDQFEARRDVCDDLGEERYDPQLDPADFKIPPLNTNANPYFPLVPGNTWIYHTTKEGEGIIETIKVEVLDDTKEIYYPADSDTPFTCIVVRDRVWEGEQDVTGVDSDSPLFLSDKLIEYTIDWYAQDLCGNVWYMGESAANYEEGELVGLEGSWKAGKDGAKPGVLMWNYFLDEDSECEPPQEIYRQEFFLGDAEDIGEFVKIKDNDDLITKDYTPIEPGVLEKKTYRYGVGVIREKAFDDEGPTGEVVELVLP